MSKILLIIDFPLNSKMAGPQLRYFEIAKALGIKHEVTLAGEYYEKDFTPPPNVQVLKIPAFKYINCILKASIPNPEFIKAINKYDFIITHGRILRALGLKKIKTPLIIDLYGPWFIEDIAAGKNTGHIQSMKGIKDLLLAGTYFLCSNNKQKEMYIGMMLMAGKTDQNIDEKIIISPIGISKEPPIKNTAVLKGVHLEININDKVVLWWGGIWDWLDPKTPIEAIKIISENRSDIKLVFKGSSQSAKEYIDLSKKLGLLNKQIFFIDESTPYSKRGDWLLESDIGIISHDRNIETRFSWRTRAMDYIWANLPIVTTEGDSIAELTTKHNLGKVVPYKDPKAMAQAIVALLDNKEEYAKIRQDMKDFAPELYWDKLIEPLNTLIDDRHKPIK